MKRNTSAILTLDVVNSSALPKNDLHLFMQISEELESFKIIQKVEIYRGDGLQSLISKSKNGLRSLLLQYCFYKKNNFDVRQSLGIGAIESLALNLSKSIGSAFELSGRGLEGMKKDNLLVSVHFEKAKLNAEWKVHSAVLSDLLENWTVSQAEAVLLYLIGKTQVEIAEQLNISQVAVHMRLKSAKVNLVQIILNRFELNF